MGSPQTLHDFVLNLLTNPDARSAFELDPEGALREAGLTDITVADVRDVIPLVVDYAPVQGLGSLVPAGDDLGLAEFQPDPAAVINQLQTVTQQLAVGPHPTGPDLNTAALGAITAVAPASLGVAGSGLTGLGIGGETPDPSTSLDAATPAEVDRDETSDTAVGAPAVSEPADGLEISAAPADASGDPLGVVDFAGDTLTGTLDQVTGLVDALGGPKGLGGVGESLGVGDTVAGLTDTVDGVTDVLDVSPLHASDASAPDDLGATSAVRGLTADVGDVVRGTTSGLLGDTGPTGAENASTSGGLLGITDELL
ncbi:IniB N-terminal domain-containing protein [Micromonospora sp. HM5-17]|jgi:hypothetical protein|uniref:IniB N-terminal domain-containing protein n=1 Tax=Micromonospora sp. HM5-17 TaxID=2487710 RepID=UPI00131559C8|nr:IniB N-terminal domain-containing protein [Micromonospora sp. HM5-17]